MNPNAKFQGPGGKDSQRYGFATTKAGKHWTEKSPEDFAYSVGSCFLDAIEEHLDHMGRDRDWLIKALHLNRHLFDRPYLLTLPQASKIARFVGLKVSLVAYDDLDRTNKKGPVNGVIFQTVWNAVGKPRDMFEVRNIKRMLRKIRRGQ